MAVFLCVLHVRGEHAVPGFIGVRSKAVAITHLMEQAWHTKCELSNKRGPHNVGLSDIVWTCTRPLYVSPSLKNRFRGILGSGLSVVIRRLEIGEFSRTFLSHSLREQKKGSVVQGLYQEVKPSEEVSYCCTFICCCLEAG